MKVVGVRIDGYNKIYFYRTEMDCKEGDTFNLRMPSGGTPEAKIVIDNSNRSYMGLKLLEESIEK